MASRAQHQLSRDISLVEARFRQGRGPIEAMLADRLLLDFLVTWAIVRDVTVFDGALDAWLDWGADNANAEMDGKVETMDTTITQAAALCRRLDAMVRTIDLPPAEG